MAAEEKVASTLNRLVDGVFLDVLSPRDKSSMAALIVDFLWRYEKDADSREEKPGNWITLKLIYTRATELIKQVLLIARDNNELHAGTCTWKYANKT